MNKKIDFGKNAESLFLILIGVGLFLLTRGNIENYSPANTIFISGVLSEAPKVGSQGGDYDYVALRIKGHKDSYRFSKCSLNDWIQEEVCKMERGDSIYLYARRKWSSRSITLKSNPPKSYRICDARSPKYGHFVEFRGFNECSDWEKYTYIPILSGILVVFGLIEFGKNFKNK